MPQLGLGSSLTRGGVLSDTPYVNAYSLEFDGTDDSIDLNITGDELGIKEEGSISFWIKKSETGTGNIINDRGTGNFLQITVVDDTSDYSVYANYDAVGSSNLAAYDNSFDVWNHFVLIWNHAENSRILYGNRAAPKAQTVRTKEDAYNWDADDDLRIGVYGTVSTPYTGLIDEVAVWNAVLTEDDVSSIYNSGVPNDLTDSASYNIDKSGNLKGWWRMGDGTEGASGNTIFDMSTANSGSGNTDGTFTDPDASSIQYSTDVPE